MKCLSLLVTLLAVQAVHCDLSLLSVLCLGKSSCSSSSVLALLGATTALTVDLDFTVDSALTLQSVTTSASKTITIASGATLNIVNTLTVATNTTVAVAGSLVVNSAATVSGNVVVGSSSNSASARFQGGLSIQQAASFVVYGSAVINDTLTIAANSTVNIASQAVVYANDNIDNVEGTVTVSGTLYAGSGASASSYTQTGGSLILGDNTSENTATGVQGSVNIDAGATLSGTGNINGNLVLQGGTVAPGNSPGTQFVNGDVTFSSTSTYTFEVDNDNKRNDRIVATGVARLNGFVHCTFLNSIPAPQSYTALTYRSRTGTFANVRGDILYLTRWSENDNTAISTQFQFSSAVATASSLAVVLLGLAFSML